MTTGVDKSRQDLNKLRKVRGVAVPIAQLPIAAYCRKHFRTFRGAAISATPRTVPAYPLPVPATDS